MNTVHLSFLISGMVIGMLGVIALTPVYAQGSSPTPTPLPTVSPIPTASPRPAELSDYDRDVAKGKEELHKDKADRELRTRVEQNETFEADEETEPAQKVEQDDRTDNEIEIEDTQDIQRDDSSRSESDTEEIKNKEATPSSTDSQREEGN